MHKALREGLANALIHADYYGRRGIVIDKEFRKISISNPGTFRISVDEAIAGGIFLRQEPHFTAAKIFRLYSVDNSSNSTHISNRFDLFETGHSIHIPT